MANVARLRNYYGDYEVSILKWKHHSVKTTYESSFYEKEPGESVQYFRDRFSTLVLEHFLEKFHVFLECIPFDKNIGIHILHILSGLPCTSFSKV